MKRLFSLSCCLILIIAFSVPVFASEQQNLISYQVTELEDGIVVICELFQDDPTGSSNAGYTWRKTIKSNGTTIGIVAIHGTFAYDGSTVSVVSKSVTQTDTYDGWSYKQNSFTSSGGTITLDGKLTKLLFVSVPFTMTLTCDKDGNISYT